MTSPSDPTPLARALLSLDGLSVGDAFGQRFFTHPDLVEGLIEARAVPKAPWHYTDDTEMALAVVDVLAARGAIDRDALAAEFARRYARAPERGYGGGAHGILRAIGAGVPWADAAREAFSGMGSFGNGGAMRSAPVGAYFADDLDALVAHADASAQVTHAHPEGRAGAVMAALAAAYAWRARKDPAGARGAGLLRFVYDRAPDGETRAKLGEALALPPDASVRLAASVLGTGAQVSAMDTVPFALWCAARHLDDYSEALWTTVAGLGDRDTTCAIVGGIVALATGPEGIPPAWLVAREPLERGAAA